jgi:hypothetical protein
MANTEVYKQKRREWLAKQPKGYASRVKLEHIRRYPERHRAITIADRYTKLGEKCEICGNTEKLERHHEDYSKPLEVRTLCKYCHEAEHTKLTATKLSPQIFKNRNCGTCAKSWPACGRSRNAVNHVKHQCNLWEELNKEENKQ